MSKKRVLPYRPDRPPLRPFSSPRPRRIVVDQGLVAVISYEGDPISMGKLDYFDYEVVPLFAASASMAMLLHRIASGTVDGMPTLIEERPLWLIKLQEQIRQTLPFGRT